MHKFTSSQLFQKMFFTTGEVEALTGVSRGSIINYCNQGKILCNKSPISKYRKIERLEIERFAGRFKTKINYEKLIKI